MSRPIVCFAHGDALDLFRGENGPRFGGSETQMYLLARLLADTGEYGVRLVADKSVEGAAYPGIEFRAARPVVQRGVPYLSRFVNRSRRLQPYRDLTEAVVVQTILSAYTIPTWETARDLGLRFVYRMSCDADVDGSLHPPEMRPKLRHVLQDAEGIMAQSEDQQRQLHTDLGVESTVVRSIVDMPADGPTLGGDYVLWAGRAAPIKRPWIMVETARLMPDVQFLMLMPVDAYYGDLFWRCIAQEAARVPNLRIIPGVSYFDMADYYRGASMFVSTSAIEGVPSVFLQSAAQGTPVVSLEVDPDGMLNDGGVGYCAEGDVEAFRASIAAYASSPALPRERGAAAHDYARRLHSPEVVGPIFLDFLHEVFKR